MSFISLSCSVALASISSIAFNKSSESPGGVRLWSQNLGDGGRRMRSSRPASAAQWVQDWSGLHEALAWKEHLSYLVPVSDDMLSVSPIQYETSIHVLDMAFSMLRYVSSSGTYFLHRILSRNDIKLCQMPFMYPVKWSWDFFLLYSTHMLYYMWFVWVEPSLTP